MTTSSKVQPPAARRLPPNAGKGRVKGVPNKVTADARAAIAAFVDGNAHRMAGWLDDVAHGVPSKTKPGEWVVPPNPSRAFDMMQAVVEYHVPKLSRQENVGDGGGPMTVVIHREA